MRLLEDIKNGGATVTFGPNMKDRLASAQFIVADDVTQYFFAINDKEYWVEEDFPNIAPPFKNFWMETSHPTHIVSEQYGRTDWDQHTDAQRPHRWGSLFTVAPKENLLREPSSFAGHTPLGFFKEADLETFKWLYEIVLFVQYPDAPITPIWAWSLPVKEDGSMWNKWDEVTKTNSCGYSYSLLPNVRLKLSYPGGTEVYKALRASAHTMLNPLLLAICFMHCKNVELVTVNPPPKLRKRNAKRGRSMFSYRTIKVGAIRKIIESSRRPGDTDITMAVNRCRGHFKTYTAERPLLGRAVGTYFWQDQLRAGKKKASVSHHDYAVGPPQK